MKLQYKILWFEDSISWFETAKAFVRDFLDENGFEMVEDHYKSNVGSVVDLLQKNNYDLILMDFNLENAKGDEIIESIRNNDLYTELLFYSQDGAKSLRRTIHEMGVDGVYCSSREIYDFEPKVTGIIRNTIRRIQDVNNMRGLVIAETIDLEIKMENILKEYFKVANHEPINIKRKTLFDKICEKKTIQIKEGLQAIGTINSKTIEDLIDEDILTAKNVYNALQSLVKAEITELNILLGNQTLNGEEKLLWQKKKTELVGLREDLKAFDEEIIKIRNTLAHVKENVNEDGIPYLESLNKNDGTKILFDNSKYIQIRKDIRRYSDVLLNLELHISSSDDSNSKEAAPSSESI